MSAPINIDARGYGKIYKAAMRNRALPLYAKAIYAYFCCYAGSGTKAYPRRDKITGDLRINKDTYTKHLHTLVDEGYIGRERTATGNLHTIIQTVKSYSGALPDVAEAGSDLLVMESIQAQGFGTVPKLVMQDRRLSAQAKAIYSYFASFAGSGSTAFPRHSTVLRELRLTDKAYYKHFNQLLNAGYLSVEQRKDKGKFSVNLYRLADVVEHPSLPRPGEGGVTSGKGRGDCGKASQPISEKCPSGENIGVTREFTAPTLSRTGMSDKLPRGGEPWETFDAMSEGGLSEKLPSERIPCDKAGHASIKNKTITNSSLEKEQNHNHQDGVVAGAQPERLAFTLPEVKRIIGYDRLLDQALAWGEMQETLGHFCAPGDNVRYMRRAREIVAALALQVLKTLNAADQAERLIAALRGEGLECMVDELLRRWDTMRSVEGYVARCLGNMLLRVER